MLEKTSEDFKEKILLTITKELIRNSADVEIFKLGQLVKQEEKEKINQINTELKKGVKQAAEDRREIRNFIKQKVKQDEEGNYLSSIKTESELEGGNPFQAFLKSEMKQAGPSRRFMPEHVLPQSLRHIMPVPLPGEVDLGKINQFIRDPVVRMIECNGPGKNIIIGGIMGTKEVPTFLTRDEIDGIIKKFSEETKIPLQEGFFKVVLGKLILSAIYSESVGSKFIIKKMVASQPRDPFAPPVN